MFLLFTQIESRLSSRYSYDFHPKISPNNISLNNYTPSYNPCNNSSNSCCIPNYEPPKEDNYNFIDPWDEYLVSKEQKNYDKIENEEEKDNNLCQVENIRGDGSVVEVCLNNQCKQENENFSYVQKYDNIEKQTRNFGIQTNVIEKSNKLEYKEEKHEHFEEVREFNQRKQEENPISSENYPACSDDIPINLISSLSVVNCHPDSPTHYEVPMDQTCNLNVSIFIQFTCFFFK